MDYNYKDDVYYEEIERVTDFQELSQQIQDDLIEWYNTANPSKDDLALLLNLYLDGQFRAWECENCGDRVYEGNPDNWDDFQGVLNQDFCYFGNKDKYTGDYLDALCDGCRMEMF